MTRAYSHRPDVEVADRWYAHAVQMVDRARAQVARGDGLDADRVGMALDDMWEALAWGWVTERPLDELEALVGRAVEVLRAGLDASGGQPVALRHAELLVATALLAGDVETAVRAAAREVPHPSQDTEWQSVALTALVRGDDAAATAAVDRLRAIVAEPTTAPVVASWLAHVDELADAVVRRDQVAFDAALADRALAVARLHRTAVMRRRSSGVLDRSAIAVARVGEQRGLVVPAGVQVVPAELLAAVGSAAARVAAPASPPRGRRWRWSRRTRTPSSST